MSFHIITDDNNNTASTDFTYGDIILIKASIDFYVAEHLNKFTSADFHKFKILLHFTDHSLSADKADDITDLVRYAYHKYDEFLDFTNKIKDDVKSKGKPSLFELDSQIVSTKHFKNLITHMKVFTQELSVHVLDFSNPEAIHKKLDYDKNLAKHGFVHKALNDVFKGTSVTPTGNIHVDTPSADLAMSTLHDMDLYEHSSTVDDIFICKAIIRAVHDSLNRLKLPKSLVKDQLHRLAKVESIYHKGSDFVVCKFTPTNNNSDDDSDKMLSVRPLNQKDVMNFIDQMITTYDNKYYEANNKE